jgi:hypothetical protein
MDLFTIKEKYAQSQTTSSTVGKVSLFSVTPKKQPKWDKERWRIPFDSPVNPTASSVISMFN